MAGLLQYAMELSVAAMRCEKENISNSISHRLFHWVLVPVVFVMGRFGNTLPSSDGFLFCAKSVSQCFSRSLTCRRHFWSLTRHNSDVGSIFLVHKFSRELHPICLVSGSQKNLEAEGRLATMLMDGLVLPLEDISFLFRPVASCVFCELAVQCSVRLAVSHWLDPSFWHVGHLIV